MKLIGICDIAALLNGPIEFFKKECAIERPYYLYDPATDKSYDTFHDLNHDKDASNKVFFY